MVIEGGIRLVAVNSGVPSDVRVRIELPANYPAGTPIAYDAGRRCVWGDLDGHVLSNGKLCLWLPPRALWDEAEPTALLQFVDQVIVFYDRYFTYEAGGKKRWPGPASKHGLDGYVEYVAEELGTSADALVAFAAVLRGGDPWEGYRSCPCASGRDFRSCHEASVRQLRRTIGKARLIEVGNKLDCVP